MLKGRFIGKRIICCILIVLAFLSPSYTEFKADELWPKGPKISSPSAIVIELNSGTVLYEKNSDEKNYPASITKIMTTMLALEYCELDEVVTFSADAVFKNEGNTSHIARDLNEKMTIEECLYAVMLESANECAYAVAEHVGEKLGGNYQTFVDLMNEKAKELGCTNTHFTNANGLPDENHWTSARDMALISKEAYKNENFRIIISTRRYVIPPTNKHSVNTYLNNHHLMIHNYRTDSYLYKYAIGGKTGYTQAAGATLVTYGEKDGLEIVCVVMNTTQNAHYEQTIELFNFSFQNFVNYNIVENESMITKEELSMGFMNNYGSYVSLNENAIITLPITAQFSDATCSVIQGEEKGSKVAEMVYTYGDKVVGSTAIEASKVTAEENYFNENASEIESAEKIIKIKPLDIILWSLLIILLVIVIILIKKLYDNFYLIRQSMKIKKHHNSRFNSIRKRRKGFGRRNRRFR